VSHHLYRSPPNITAKAACARSLNIPDDRLSITLDDGCTATKIWIVMSDGGVILATFKPNLSSRRSLFAYPGSATSKIAGCRSVRVD
jgi:hypothetical protein